MIQGIADSQISVVSELHLTAACITSKGLKNLRILETTQIDLQVLNLANNDLGNDTSRSLYPIFRSLVSLDLSNTKMGRQGCFDLADNVS